MSDRASWFRCDAARLLGALSGMEPDTGYLYTVVLLRIYEVGGPIQDDETILSRRTGFTVRRVTTALDWLLRHGKVERLDDGRLDSSTTHAELLFREKSLNDAKNAGKESAKRRQTFKTPKYQSNQQTEATPVERPIEVRSTVEQRPSTDRDIEEDIRNLTVSCPKPVRTRNDYPDDFERFWQGYPRDALMSKSQAAKQWGRLSPDDRAKAINSLPAFRAYCSQHTDYRPVHAERYLSTRRFDGFSDLAVTSSAKVFVKLGSPQWLAWNNHYLKFEGKRPPQDRDGKGWYFPTEWPPTYQEAAE